MKKNNNFKKKDLFLIIFIVIIGLIFRIYKINTPLADHHSWRQADTAAVAKNFLKEGFSILTPKFDDLSSIPSGKDNPNGYRMVEFPIYNTIFAFFYRYFPFFTLDIYGRLTSIFFSLIISVIIYYLVLKEEGRIAAFFSSLIFAIMPFFVYYSRVVLPEMTAVAFSLLSIASLYLYLQNKKNFSVFFYFLSMFFYALSLLTKPTTIFFSFPLAYLFFRKFRFEVIKKISFYLFFLIGITPFVLWRIWILNFPEGIPASQWLLFQVNTYQGLQNIFFKPAFFRWLFKERIATLILGNYLVVFLVLGFLKKPLKSFFFLWMGIGHLLYLFIFQGGNVQHDYYQVIILPSLAIFSGIGISMLIKEKIFFPILNLISVIILISFSFFFSYYHVKDFYSYPQDLITTANLIKAFTKENDKIITDRSGDTTLLYLSERKGFPAITDDLETMKKKGGKYLITDKKELAEKIKNQYKLIFESDRIFIFEL